MKNLIANAEFYKKETTITTTSAHLALYVAAKLPAFCASYATLSALIVHLFGLYTTSTDMNISIYNNSSNKHDASRASNNNNRATCNSAQTFQRLTVLKSS